MKKIIVLLLVLLFVSISTSAFSERWDGATVDMSGSSSGSSNICDQPRPIFDPGKAAMWDGMCGNRNNSNPNPTPNPQPVNPRDDYSGNSGNGDFNWEEWQREFNRDWERPQDDQYRREQYERQKRQWAVDMSHWMVYSMPTYFYYHPDTAANLPQLRQDLYNDFIRGRVINCLAHTVYNDAQNVSNMVNSGNYDAAVGRYVMAINNCYLQVR